MGLKRIENGLLYLLYLTLGTYAIPALRIGSGEFAFPYAAYLIFVLLGVLVARLVKDQGSIYLSNALLMFTFVYLLSLVVSTSISQFPDLGMTVKSFFFTMTPFLVACVSDKVKFVRRAIICLGISGFVVFLFGAYGFVTGEIGSQSEHLLGYFGVTYEPATRNSDMLFLQSTFWILLSILLFGTRSRMRIVYAVGVALLAAGMFLSLVRGTWITTSLTLLIIMVIGSRYRPQIRYVFPLFLVVVVVCLTGITFLLGQEQVHLIVNRFSTLSTLSIDGGNSNLARIDLAGRILRIIPEHPFGVGVANVRFYLADFPFGVVNHAENVYLQLCVEQGIFGVAIFLLLLGWILSRLSWFVRDTNHRPEEVWVGWALLGIVINWLFYGLFNLMIDSMWYWLVMSLAVSLCNLTEREMLRCRRTLATCVPPTLIPQSRSTNP